MYKRTVDVKGQHDLLSLLVVTCPYVLQDMHNALQYGKLQCDEFSMCVIKVCLLYVCQSVTSAYSDM